MVSTDEVTVDTTVANMTFLMVRFGRDACYNDLYSREYDGGHCALVVM